MLNYRHHFEAQNRNFRKLFISNTVNYIHVTESIHVPYHHHEKNFILLITINTAFCFKIKGFVFKIKFILCNNPDTTRLLFSINLIKMTGIQNYNMNINMTFCNQVCILTWNGLFYRVFSLRNIEYDHCN